MRMFRDIYESLFEFVRTFGAFQLFFLRLIRHSPKMLLKPSSGFLGVEATPGAIRLRKRILDPHERKRVKKREAEGSLATA